MELEKLIEELKVFVGGVEAGRQSENRRLRRNTVKGYTISTMYTFDCGYETAIWKDDIEKIVIVERYDDEETALEGHSDWVNLCKEHEPAKLFSVQFEEFEYL